MTPPIAVTTMASDRNCARMSRLPRARRHAHADLARPLRDRDEHDVHDADAADEQRDAADRGEQQAELVLRSGDRLEQLGAVDDSEVLDTAVQRRHEAAQQLLRLVDPADVVDGNRDLPREFLAEQAQRARLQRHEHRVVLVLTARAALASEHADDLERRSADQHPFAERILPVGEQLLVHGGAEHGDGFVPSLSSRVKKMPRASCQLRACGNTSEVAVILVE